jgi:hypothetical protein
MAPNVGGQKILHMSDFYFPFPPQVFRRDRNSSYFNDKTSPFIFSLGILVYTYLDLFIFSFLQFCLTLQHERFTKNILPRVPFVSRNGISILLIRNNFTKDRIYL